MLILKNSPGFDPNPKNKIFWVPLSIRAIVNINKYMKQSKIYTPINCCAVL